MEFKFIFMFKYKCMHLHVFSKTICIFKYYISAGTLMCGDAVTLFVDLMCEQFKYEVV